MSRWVRGDPRPCPSSAWCPSLMAEVQIRMAHPSSEEEEEGDVVVTVHARGTTSLDVVRARLDSTPSQEDPFYVVDLGRLATLFSRWSSELPNIQPFYGG